jgi:hypothetical protein
MPSFSIFPAGFVTLEWVQRPKSAYQCRKLKASIRILQIFHLKQPLWATEWFQNCWCTSHEEGVAVDTGLMSSLALTICNWLSCKTLYVCIKFEKCFFILVISSHQGTEIYIVLWGGRGKGNPLKIGINLGASEESKQWMTWYQRIEDPRSNETCQAGTWRYFAPLALFLQTFWNSMFERYKFLNSLQNGEHLSTALMTVFLVWDAIIVLKDMNQCLRSFLLLQARSKKLHHWAMLYLSCKASHEKTSMPS